MSQSERRRWLVWEDNNGRLHSGDYFTEAGKRRYCFEVVRVDEAPPSPPVGADGERSAVAPSRGRSE
jgi:hypothetical protein